MKQIIHGQAVDVPQGSRVFRKTVNGESVDMTAAEIAEQLTQEAEWQSQQSRVQIIEQIQELELLETPRRISEAILGMDNGWLANNRAQIGALRTQL